MAVQPLERAGITEPLGLEDRQAQGLGRLLHRRRGGAQPASLRPLRPRHAGHQGAAGGMEQTQARNREGRGTEEHQFHAMDEATLHDISMEIF